MRRFQNSCAVALMVLMVASPFQVRAGMIATDQVATDAVVRAQRDRIRAFVNRADAQREMAALGIDPKTAGQRVDAMTNEEVMQVAGKLAALPAGAMDKFDIMIILLVAILVVIAI